MNHLTHAGFALIFAGIFIGFSPMDAPYGMVVALGGSGLCISVAAVFWVLHWVEVNRVDPNYPHQRVNREFDD